MASSNDTISVTANDQINQGLMITSAILSTIGCVITIATYFLISDIKTMSRHIIMCISIADLVTCLSNMIGLTISPNRITSQPCVVQSFFGTTAVLASFLWTMILTIYLYMVIVKERFEKAKRMIFPFSHMLCWAIPLIINVVAMATSSLGNDGDLSSSGWCWIKMVNKGTRFIFAEILLSR